MVNNVNRFGKDKIPFLKEKGYHFFNDIYENYFLKWFPLQSYKTFRDVIDRFGNGSEIIYVGGENEEDRVYPMMKIRTAVNAFQKRLDASKLSKEEEFEKDEIMAKINHENDKEDENNPLESDMEKYSNYLINNKYQNESKENKKKVTIVITEEQYKFLVEHKFL